MRYILLDVLITKCANECAENEELLVELVQYCADTFPPEFKPQATVTVTVTEPSADSAEATTDGDAKEAKPKEETAPEPLFSVDTDLMCRAMAFSFERLARLMLKLGAPIQISSVKGMTPLDFAVRQRNPNILKLVIEAGAELGINRTLAYHPLHLAVIYGMPEMVQQLVDAGVNLNLRNTSDSTATYLGSWHRHFKAIEPIVKAGADLSNDTTGVWTPLTCEYSSSFNGFFLQRYRSCQ